MRGYRLAPTWNACGQVISVHKITLSFTHAKLLQSTIPRKLDLLRSSEARSPSMSQTTDPLDSSRPVEAFAMNDAWANAAPLILVAEDNRMSRVLLTEQLRLLGLDAEAVETGSAALGRWRDGRVSVVLTDLQMPEMDGYELAQAIRREEGEDAHTPIVALTASALEERTGRWRDAGIDDYLVKPVEMVTLNAMLWRWLAPPGAARSGAGHSSAYPREHQPGVEPVDLQVLTEMVGDDTKTVIAFLEDFARSASEDAKAMEDALKSGQADKIRFVAHQFKASARSVGSLRLGNLCAAVEDVAVRTGEPAMALAWDSFQAELEVVQRWILKFSAERQVKPRDTTR
jgi:two-component system sensor histidine kinase/response regulator